MRRNATQSGRKICSLLVTIVALPSLSACSRLQPATPARTVTEKSTTAQVIEGRVVAVVDGDTIEVVDASNTLTRIRIRGIDAPEKAQAFGSASKQQMSSLVFNRDVRVFWQEKDRYGRTLGRVDVDGHDVGLQMVQAGMAWHFKRYENSQPPEERIVYANAELEARQSKTGLWADTSPVAPWDYRKSKRGQ